jgi:large subunit ribosomal protein L10
MPSKKVLQQKKQIVEELAEQIKGSACGVLANHKGINVADDTKLRKSMREAQVKYFVVKNKILSRAFEIAGLSELNTHLKGETVIALSEQDIIIAPKLVYGQVEESKGTYSIKAGFINGEPVDAATIIEYAKLPSKEVLVSKLLFMLQSPVQRFAIAISQIAEKGGESAEPQQAESTEPTEPQAESTESTEPQAESAEPTE